MKINDEFIGRNVEIIESHNAQLIGLKGKIVDETKNSFKMLIGKNVKVILKNGSKFRIEDTIFEGDKLLKRSEDRIKQKNN